MTPRLITRTRVLLCLAPIAALLFTLAFAPTPARAAGQYGECFSSEQIKDVVKEVNGKPETVQETVRTPSGVCQPGWEITSHSNPTDIAPGGHGYINLYVFNVGGANSVAGDPVTVTDVLPAGVTALYAGEPSHPEQQSQFWDCTGNAVGESPRLLDKFEQPATVVTCTPNLLSVSTFLGGGAPLGSQGIVPFGTAVLQEPHPISLEVAVAGTPGQPPHTLTNQASVGGGGARPSVFAATSQPLHISSQPAPFGVANWDGWFSNANGTLDTQAGSHPYEATFDFEVSSEVASNYPEYQTVEVSKGVSEPVLDSQHFERPAGGEFRDVTVDLPPGFVGNPTAVPQCPREDFDANSVAESACPPSTVVGFATSNTLAIGFLSEPIYNLVPPPGVAAEFAFTIEGESTFLDSGVRSGGDSGIVTHTDNNPTGRGVLGAVVTLWGTPGDPSHDPTRCAFKSHLHECTSGAGTAPLLTLPTACGAPQPVSVEVNEWGHESVTAAKTVYLHNSSGPAASPSEPTATGFTGCERLSFGPSISTQPDTVDADSPAGLTVEVKPPVGGLSIEEGLSAADIQDTTVTLPRGLVINPGQAAGLQACKTGDLEGGDDLPLPGENGEEERFAGPAKCPGASKIGTVVIKTPLIEGGAEKQLEGNVFVLESEPPEIKLLVTASGDGVNTKLIGTVHLSEQTGQLTTTFQGTPELPFTDFKLSFSGGAQAALDTPTQCGSYGSEQGFFADFTPWSSPFDADVFPTAEFAIEHGPGGGACSSSPLPFHPELTAGATTDQAGGYTDFSLLLQRGDGQQRIDGLQFKAPEGLTGFLSKVPLCTNAQAEANACPAASKIGHTVVESGPGPYPLVVPEPGQEPAPIYLTESYDGAPFGLAIVVPLHVGPFTLPTQRVRAKIEVNPTTSALTITTNPLPQEVAGVPTDLREIDAVIERPEFMVNPTNCTPSEFSGTAYGTAPPGQNEPNTTAPISSHFGVGACQALKFAPSIAFSTNGKTSKADGADLITKLTYPSAPQGTYADIGYVKVELPKALPSRLTTLQKACTQKQFEANPAGCPAASDIGHAVVHTPLLPVPLEGPAIFVSHGGEAFPSLTMVLQGDGVTVDLVGTTFISKSGITSTTFKTVPDDPFSSFELVLPQGPYSALAANGNLCAQKLVLPNEWVGQNGAPLKNDSPVTVTGCAPSIHVTSHKVKGNTATIQVSVPSAGKLTATAKGLSKGSKKTAGAGTVTVKLHLTTAEQATLKTHKGRKLAAKVKLSFAPKRGGRLTTSTTVLIG